VRPPVECTARAGSTSAPTRSIWSTRSAEVASGAKIRRLSGPHPPPRNRAQPSRHGRRRSPTPSRRSPRRRAGWASGSAARRHPSARAKRRRPEPDPADSTPWAPSPPSAHRYRRARVPHRSVSEVSSRPAPASAARRAARGPPARQHGDGRGAEGITPDRPRVSAGSPGQCAHPRRGGRRRMRACGARSPHRRARKSPDW